MSKFGEAHLSWNQNPEANLAGYIIWYGTDGVTFPYSIDVGLTATPAMPVLDLTTFLVYGLLYFAVSAYNSSGLESGRSAAVSKAIAPKLHPRNWP
jgi:hypothetical protein